MRKIKEILRLKLDARLSHEQIAAALGISKGVVTKYIGLATAAGLTLSQLQESDETQLQHRLAGPGKKPHNHVQPDFGRVHQELRRKGMTLAWEEYCADHADQQTYAYSQYCDKYNRERLYLSMDVDSWISTVAEIAAVRFVSVDVEIALKSTSLPGDFHTDPVDRMIVATARKLAVPLVTKDEKIRASTFWQSAAG